MAASRAGKGFISERRALALRLKVTGHRLDEIVAAIAKEPHLPPYGSVAAASQDIGRAIKDRARERREAADDLIELEVAKLDEQEIAAWGVLRARHYVVNQGRVVWLSDSGDVDLGALPDAKDRIAGRERPLLDDAPVLDAIGILLKIAERRAKLLGLDAPVKRIVEVQTGEGVDEKISALLARLQQP